MSCRRGSRAATVGPVTSKDLTTATASASRLTRSGIAGFAVGALVGLLGGLVGLGGAEFRLPLLLTVFAFARTRRGDRKHGVGSGRCGCCDSRAPDRRPALGRDRRVDSGSEPARREPAGCLDRSLRATPDVINHPYRVLAGLLVISPSTRGPTSTARSSQRPSNRLTASAARLNSWPDVCHSRND